MVRAQQGRRKGLRSTPLADYPGNGSLRCVKCGEPLLHHSLGSSPCYTPLIPTPPASSRRRKDEPIPLVPTSNQERSR